MGGRFNVLKEDALAQSITIAGDKITGRHTDPRDPRAAAAIRLPNVNGAVIKDNVIGPSAAPANTSQSIRLQNCKAVKKSENEY